MKQLTLGLLLTISLLGLSHATNEIIMCTQQYEPVCGIDGKTYGNSCMAGDMEIAYEGECISEDEVLQDTIDRAHETGMTRYNSVDTFRADDYFTREQATKMIPQALSVTDISLDQNMDRTCARSDEEDIDPTLIDYVRMSCYMGLFRGTEEGTFMPNRALTYAELHIVIDRLITLAPALEDYKPDFARTSDGVRRGALITIMRDMVTSYQDHQWDSYQNDLNAAQQTWSTFELTDYGLIQQSSCFCPEDYTRPMRYTVVSGSVDQDSLIYTDDQTSVTVDARVMSVSDAFAKIQDAIDNQVASLRVNYDPIYGYPISITIDHDYMIADEEEDYSLVLIVDGAGDGPLAGKWTLELFDGVDVTDYDITLIFSGDRFTTQICNRIGGSYSIDDQDILRFTDMVQTEMYCEDTDLMNIENAFTSITAPNYYITTQRVTIEQNGHAFVFIR